MEAVLGEIKVAISSDFLKAFSMVPHKQQSKVREFVEKFRMNPLAPAINYEKIKHCKDPNLRSVRIDDTYRGIVLKPDVGNVFLLLWVDHHDKAYQWAENKVYKIHPETGSLQVVDVHKVAPGPSLADTPREEKGLFHDLKDNHLLQIGVPVAFLPLVRSVMTEADLDRQEAVLPQEAYEALFLYAAGYSFEEVLKEVEKQEVGKEVDTGDFAKALENPDTMRRFHVVEDALELAEILNAPLEQWRVFLHPSQRKIVEKNVNGPVRVLGGAGTGKTVCAIHRAKHLAENVFKADGDRILFTTFTRNLAADIRENLRKICPVDILRRIEVVNLDAWVSQFLQKNGYEHTIVYEDDTRDCWTNALNLAPKNLDLPEAFFRDEWEQIIQAQGVSCGEDYLKASRLGRGRKLNRVERKSLWPVFEEYRAQLNEKGFKEAVDAIRDARVILQSKGSVLPYKAVIVDEGQDMGAQAFKLIRQMIPADGSTNDLFLVGDGHQRIYRHKVVLGQCGINIKGRSYKLKINYRTTDETRKWATRLLEGRKIDDLDAGVDDQKGYKALLHGDPPRVVNMASMAQETDFIVNHLKQLKSQSVPINSVCLVCRTHSLLLQYEASLQAAGFATYLVKRNAAENRSAPGLRLATMHRVKGLEFDHIVIAGVNEGIVPLQIVLEGQDNPLAVEENELRERALLYVSATRAKKDVLVTSFGKKSRFI